MLTKPEKPTVSLVSRYLMRYRQKSEDVTTDEAISKLFQTFPRNSQLEEVLLKVVALNDLYNTNILATTLMAKHICGLNIDSQLEQKSPELVNAIALLKVGSKTRRNYSFASKYCSWHMLDAYPIYDSFVERLIWAYQKFYPFTRFKRGELQDYPRYKEIIEAFRNHYGLTQFSFKELDKFLWLYGKDYADRLASASSQL